jgi:hypothetical protein
MTDKTNELAIDVPAVAKSPLERAAAERGLSVSEFLEGALRKLLIDTGYIDQEAAD